MRLKWIRLFVVLLAAVLLGSCHKSHEVQPSFQYLVSSQAIVSKSASQLSVALIGTPLSTLPKYAATVYKISYKTKFKDQEIVASGLVVLPGTTDPVPMVSYQHGTIASHAEAPSELPASDLELTLYAGLASTGFISVVPDFVGFGSSADILHPYYVEDLTAPAILDMIRAAREFVEDRNFHFNGKLFLAGYSQGGYATMATHKAIEQSGLDGFNLIASFPAAGGYDVKAMQEYFFGLASYSEPFYIAYVAFAYKTHLAGWTQPLSDFFQEPYASRIPGLFDGSMNGSQINGQLTSVITDLISPGLLANIDSDPKYGYIVDAFNQNSLTDWKPTIRMMMYHGDADTTVPYSNSVITYQKLIANGASSSVVTLTTLPGADHGSGFFPYLEDFVPKMIGMK